MGTVNFARITLCNEYVMDVVAVCKKWLFAWVVFGIFSSLALASSSSLSKREARPWFVGAALGWAWPSFSKSHTSVLNGSSQPAPANSDAYSMSTPNSAADVSLFAGYRWMREARWFPLYSLALRYQYLASFKMNGTVQQYSLPDFSNYHYQVQGNSSIFTVQAKANIYEYRSFSPYVSLGLGVAFNTMGDYKETAVSGVTPRISPAYRSKTSSDVAYNLGAGLDYFVRPNVTVSLGYEFAVLGNVQTGNGTGEDWTDASLKFGRLSTHTVLLSVAYQLPVG